MISLCVLYPQPINRKAFDADYGGHLRLVREKTGMPFAVSKFLDGDQSSPPYYQMFTMTFSSMVEFESVLTPEVTDVLNADAERISTGGKPVVLVSSIVHE